MKISPIITKNYRKFAIKNQSIAYKGKPLKITDLYPDASTFSKYLASASYWDVHSDDLHTNYIDIRKNNLDKIDTLSEYEKNKFISQYCSATGFPSLKNISENIENEFIISASACATELNYKSDSDFFSITRMGYDSTCSVGKRYALPGSDVDRGYIILQGCNDDQENQKIVEKYSEKLWHYTDQRLLSFNHYKSFPIIKTEKQVMDDFDYYDRINSLQNQNEYNANMSNYISDDFIAANSFLIELTDYVPAHKKTDFITNAYLAEVLREGKVLKENLQKKEFLDHIKQSSMYNYSNITQLKGIKQSQDELDEKYKTKYFERKKLCEDYKEYNIEQKIETIKAIISSSCEIPNNKKQLFVNTTNIAGQVKKLLSKLMYGNQDLSLSPKIRKIDDGYEIAGGTTKNNTARLYLGNFGNDTTTIYAEFESLPMINYVIANKNNIKAIDEFSNVRKMQFVAPKNFDEDGFSFVRSSEDSRYSVFECEF